MFSYVVKPIVEWPGTLLPAYKRKRSQFNTPWGKTLKLLEREIRHLGGRNVILQMALREQDIRLDGGIKANARPEHPGIILTFDSSEHGAMSYHTDLYMTWGDNVRAVALALEALRMVDRYGVNKAGTQYAGYKRLPSAGEATNGRKRILTAEEAARFVGTVTELDSNAILTNKGFFEIAYKLAAKALHPDNQDTGDESRFIDLQDAAALLKKKFGV